MQARVSLHLEGDILQDRLPLHFEHHRIAWLEAGKNLPQLLRIVQGVAIDGADYIAYREIGGGRGLSAEQTRHQDAAIGAEVEHGPYGRVLQVDDENSQRQRSDPAWD